MQTCAYMDTPFGRMLLAARGGALTGAWFAGQKYFPAMAGWQEDANEEVLRRTVAQLAEFFAGRRARFDLPLAPAGTAFQREVWRAISGVPLGETITYGELARRAGADGSARAAGAATGRNPISLIVPCHRIVGANGSLTGYAGGLDRKRSLLAFEAECAVAAGECNAGGSDSVGTGPSKDGGTSPTKDGGTSPPWSDRPRQRSLGL